MLVCINNAMCIEIGYYNEHKVHMFSVRRIILNSRDCLFSYHPLVNRKSGYIVQ